MKILPFKKQIVILLSSAAILTSCSKSDLNESKQSIELSSFSTTSPTVITLDDYEVNFVHSLLEWGENEYWDVLEDGNGTQYCEPGSGLCCMSNKPVFQYTPRIVSYIEQEKLILEGLENTSEYFLGEDWKILFWNISEEAVLLNKIRNNELRIIPAPTANEYKITAFVLTSAMTLSEISSENVYKVWVY